MSIASEFATEWLDLGGQHVTFEGQTWIIRVDRWWQKYPYARDVTNVRLEPTAETERSESYLAIKRELGDDWSTDVLSLDPEQQVQILQQVK